MPKQMLNYPKKMDMLVPQKLIIGICGFHLVTPLRFERRTHTLEGCCSIQLSYGAIP